MTTTIEEEEKRKKKKKEAPSEKLSKLSEDPMKVLQVIY